MTLVLSRIGIDENRAPYNQVTDVDSLRHHILAHYVFCLKNKVAPLEAETQATGVTNGRKQVQINNAKNVDKVIISYPLILILRDFLENTDHYKGYQGQLKIAEKYNIANLGIIYRIAKNLGCIELLEWKYISLSVKTFKNLQKELEENFDEYKPMKNHQRIGRNGEGYFRLMKKLKITNPEYLYGAISSLGLTNELSFIKIRITNIDIAKKIIEIAKSMSLGNNGYFSIDAVIIIAKEVEIDEKSLRRIGGLLKSFGFEVDQIPGK